MQPEPLVDLPRLTQASTKCHWIATTHGTCGGGGGALACTMHKVGPRLHLVERGLQFCRHAAQLSSRFPETTSLHNTGGSKVKGEGG